MIDQLERILTLDNVMMRFISHCVGKPVFASKSLFRRILKVFNQ